MTRKSFNRITMSVLGLLIFMFVLASCEKDIDTVKTNTDNEGKKITAVTGYPIVGTNQTTFYNNKRSISEPSEGARFYGQNAHYPGNIPRYQDNGDGTVTDLVTGLMWQQTADQNGDGVIDYDDELTYSDLKGHVSSVTTGGYTDWRIPTIKEQYSLIMFNGQDVSGLEDESALDGTIPFINTDYFGFAYGDTNAGERIIDAQYVSSNEYEGGPIEMVFGVNFADGRIKGYGTYMPGEGYKKFNYLLVRGRTDYGVNNFVDNGDGTITDNATGLMWMQNDNGEALSWKNALDYAEDEEFAGYSDWRLPDAKELQSIVDYSRSPDVTNSAAIDPLFNCSQITNEGSDTDYPFYWTNTTHKSWLSDNEGTAAVYVCFGRALGYMFYNWVDVHGAGAQRSDPKLGDPDDYPTGHGPQGDAIRIYNYVRLVRNVN